LTISINLVNTWVRKKRKNAGFAKHINNKNNQKFCHVIDQSSGVEKATAIFRNFG